MNYSIKINHKMMTLSMLVLFVISTATNTVSAISLPQKKLFQKNILYYDIETGCNLGTSNSTNAPLVQGGEVEFPLDDGSTPVVDNAVSAGTATKLSATATRGAQFVRFLGHKNTIGGIRPDEARFYSEHPSGNALDLHTSKMGTAVPPGDEFDFYNSLAETLAKNHEALSVHEVIWNNKIISSRNWAVWRPYSGYGATTSPTLQHKDHIHVKFNSDTGSTKIKLYGTLKSGATAVDATPAASPTPGDASATEATLPETDTPIEQADTSTCACTVNGSAQPVSAGATSAIQEYPDAVVTALVAELKSIKATIEPNLAAYQAAASRWGIPWQAIAATHWREGTAGSNKSMVNGTQHPSQSDLGGRQYIWGSANATVTQRSANKDDIPGSDPTRRFYGTLEQDIDYATWLLIEHGTRRNFDGSPDKLIEKAQGPGLSKEEWTDTWSAYLGGSSMGYGNFGKDNNGRMGAGAIFAFLGGLNEKPPVPSTKYPGTADSDYDKVAGGVNGAVTASQGTQAPGCNNTVTDTTTGSVNTDGYTFPIAAKKKSDYDTFGALSAVPCKNSGGCHHNENHPNAGFAFDLGVKGYGPDRSQNAPVYAITDGTLDYVNTSNRRDSGYNKCNSITLVASKDKYVYWYGHLNQERIVRTGQSVKAGEVIGHVGPTECADGTAPHLHISRVPPGKTADSEPDRDRGLIEIINKTFEDLPE